MTRYATALREAGKGDDRALSAAARWLDSNDRDGPEGAYFAPRSPIDVLSVGTAERNRLVEASGLPLSAHLRAILDERLPQAPHSPAPKANVSPKPSTAAAPAIPGWMTEQQRSKARAEGVKAERERWHTVMSIAAKRGQSRAATVLLNSNADTASVIANLIKMPADAEIESQSATAQTEKHARTWADAHARASGEISLVDTMRNRLTKGATR